MELDLTKQQYNEEFNPADYYNRYHAAGKGVLVAEWRGFALKKLHDTFTSGGVEGNTLIDIGAGSSIYHLLSACEVFKNIITSDYLPQNLTEIKKWLKNDPRAFDWSSAVKWVCEMEGNSDNCQKKEEKLRQTVKRVIKCDVFKKNPLEPHVVPPADCLLSCLCLEAACNDLETFYSALKNLRTLIKPGGHMVLMSGLNATFYYVGDMKFSALSMTKEYLEKALIETGYQIEKIEVAPRLKQLGKDVADFQGFYYVHARKPHDS
ncbi:nicotinamide N-methyltransferase-like [Bombina bombina]|uniref:nicotinamide N-methyltransferase-like n=1 Tax=Bombina bombina TaxID=8345 RepID=UPI00235AD589|nr:nicotinamide N-methyltransferase-like [Bombina bombina]XP_053546903.1 nicotinamide N-methyltransferase-like [Bombina bombina]